MRALAVVAYLSSPACFNGLFSPATLLFTLTSCAQPVSHITQSFVCHSPIPGAPAVLTSSILHMFMTQPHWCQFLLAPPGKFPSLPSSSQTLPGGQLRSGESSSEPAPAPSDTQVHFLLQLFFFLPLLGKSQNPGSQFQHQRCPSLRDVHQICKTLSL